jgi:hypothetical protein
VPPCKEASGLRRVRNLNGDSMGYHTISGTTLRFGLIAYDTDGNERPEADGIFSQTVIHDIAAQGVTNVFFFSHGWKGDVPAAIDQYDRWIGAMVKSADLARSDSVFPNFRPSFIGLHWPSLPWGSEEAGPDGSFTVSAGISPDQLLGKYIERLGDRPVIRNSLQSIFAEARRNIAPSRLPDGVRNAYFALNDALELGSGGVSAPPDADREAFDPDATYEACPEDGANFGDFNFGGLLGPLRQLSYWTMKKRARAVGESGMHQFLKDLQTATNARIHLMGHSFGTIVVSGMLGGPNAQSRLKRSIDSVALIQGAVSLWCYSPNIPFPNAGAGYFSHILPDGKITGPLITTRSRFDKAVGVLYPLASKVSGSPSFEAGMPEYGAIGAYGIQGMEGSLQRDGTMLPSTESYQFARGKVYNLESSEFICHGDGVSGAHSDIDGPEVAHAIWEAAFASA